MYKAFKFTLGILAALAIPAVLLAGIIFTVSELDDYAKRPSAAEITRRNAEQAEYDKTHDDSAEPAQPKPVWHAPKLPQQFAYVHPEYGHEAPLVYSEEINQGLVVATLQSGERVEVLRCCFYGSAQIKTHSGVIGWVHPSKTLRGEAK